MSNNNKIVVSNAYTEASIKFRMAWAEYMNHEGRVKYEVVNLVKILENDGLPRMQAIQKIVNDHKDLIGFSRASIYRELPDDMKDTTLGRGKKPLGEPNFSSEKLGSTNIQDKGNEEDETTYDSTFVNSLIAENEQLKIENFRLKKDYQELETKYKKLLNKTKSD